MTVPVPQTAGPPVSFDPRVFRDVLAHLATGVTIVTAHGEAEPLGMAANSVTSVSLDPPLVLLCPAKSSTTWPSIRDTGSFCINIMAGHHADLTRRFAMRNVDRFAEIEHVRRPTGPGLTDAVAWIECDLEVEHDAGDHTIAIGRVVAIEATATPGIEPLVFFRGAYGSFRPPAEA